MFSIYRGQLRASYHVIGEILIVSLVVAAAILMYTTLSNTLQSNEKILNTSIGTPVIIKEVIPIPPNWYKVYTTT